MGRFHAQNYTRKNIINDLDLLDQMNSMGVSGNAIESILHTMAWAWTAYKDITLKNGEEISKLTKFQGCEFWSEKAFLDKFEQINGVWKVKTDNIKKGLRHEHIVPKILFKQVVEQYLDQSPSILTNKLSDLKKAMNKNLIGCVVTEAEAKMLDAKGNGCRDKMPPPQDKCDFCGITDPWARYKKTAQNSSFSKRIYKLEWESPKSKNGSWKFKSATVYLIL